MLIELRIRNFAVVRDLTLEIGPGLTALTGETGAGKSIIVDALALLLGERASSDVVRAGEGEATVEAVFDLSGLPEVESRLAEAGIPGEGRLLILRRVVAREGRNRAWVNGSPATAGLVGSLGRLLVDLHGQHDHQSLLRTSEQRAILDAFGDAGDLEAAVREAHAQVVSLVEALETLDARRRELESRREFISFQLDEIDVVDPRQGEDTALAEELEILEHAEDLLSGAAGLADTLYGGEDALSDRIAAALEGIRSLERFDPALEAQVSALQDAYHSVTDVGRWLGDYQGRVDLDPGRLEEIRTRLDGLTRLKRKYGATLEDVLEAREGLRGQLAELDGAGLDRSRLQRELDAAREHLAEAADRLSERRSWAADRLESEISELLPSLGLTGSTFKVSLDPLAEVGSFGAEEVEFRVSLNQGFEPGPLARVASGGELARVMLALKTVLARLDSIPTLIFDEIDAGIGGVVANAVAERLCEVGREHQVLVVTHLAQVASRADGHLRVEKGPSEEGLADARLQKLHGTDRVTEVARLLGGDPDSEASRGHARELLEARR